MDREPKGTEEQQLKKEGFVMQGHFPDVTEVRVYNAQTGETETVHVQPEVRGEKPRNQRTIFHPVD
jgi:hypothetical protein